MMKNDLSQDVNYKNSLLQRKGSFKNFVCKSVSARQQVFKRIMSFKHYKNNCCQDECEKIRNLNKFLNPRYSLKETYICSYIKEMNTHIIHHRGSVPEIMDKPFVHNNCKIIELDKFFEESRNHHHFAVFSSLIKPYMISVEKTQGGKDVISVKPSITHALATEVLAQKLEHYEDLKNSSNCSIDSISGSFNCPLSGRQNDLQNPNGEKSRHISPFRYVKPLKSQETFGSIQHNILILIEALTAVEVDDHATIKTLFSNNEFDVNASINSGIYREFRQKIGLLDIALMLGNYKCANLLLDNGAMIKQDIDIVNRRRIVNDVKKTFEEKKYYHLERENDKKHENHREVNHFVEQSKIIKKMEEVLGKNETTGHVIDAKVYVSSSNTVLFKFFTPPNDLGNSIIKYRLEWSLSKTFDEIVDYKIIYDIRQNCIEIDNLIHGNSYCFRIIAGSIYGDGIPVVADPYPITISSWEDVDNVTVDNEIDSHQEAINALAKDVEKFKNSIVWQRIFPTNNEGNAKKKPSRLRYLFSASKRFVKNVQKGIYLASIIYTTDKVLCTVDDALPIIAVDENFSNMSKDDMKWLIKLSRCWDQLNILQDMANIQSTNFQFRTSIIDSINSMINALGIKDIGTVHHVPIIFEKKEAFFIVTVRYTFEGQLSQGLATKWTTLSKIIRKKTSCPALDFLNSQIINILNFYESYQIPLDRGLYLCYLKTFSTLTSVDVLVPENLPNSLPFVCVRDNPHVSKEEWEWIQILNEFGPYEEDSTRTAKNYEDNENNDNDEDFNDSENNSEYSKILPTYVQKRFQEKIYRSIQIFLNDLGISPTKIMNHRLYRLRVFQLHPDVSMILIVPNIDEVCSMITDNNEFAENTELLKSCQKIPIPIFEMLHLSTYQPEFMTSFCQLSIFIEHYLVITQYEYRKCIVDRDEKVYKELFDRLNEFKNQLAVIWKNAKWISSIATIARDAKKSNSFFDFSKIPIYKKSNKFYKLDSNSDIESDNNGYYSDFISKKFINNANLHHIGKDYIYNSDIYLNNVSSGRKKKSFKTKSNVIFNFDKLFINEKKTDDTKTSMYRNCITERSKLVTHSSKKIKKDESSLRIRSASQGSNFFKFRNRSSKNDSHMSRKGRLTRNETASVINDHECNDINDMKSEDMKGFGLLRVHVAFNYCQNIGASIRLRVTKSTTCKEVISLIVKQLNYVKPKVINETNYNSFDGEQPKEINTILYKQDDFCLVVILGARERRLRNEFQPLNLSSPWNKGKLYIRHIDTPCEAIMVSDNYLKRSIYGASYCMLAKRKYPKEPLYIYYKKDVFCERSSSHEYNGSYLFYYLSRYMESNIGESRRASLPAFSNKPKSSNRLIIPQSSFNTPTLLEDVAEFDLDPPYISQQTSSSAETSPRILSPGARPLSAKLYRKHLNIGQMHNFTGDFDDVCDSSISENKQNVKICGTRSAINKTKAEKQKGLNLKNFIISKKGKIVENKTSFDNEKNRRATCPEIWLSCESDTHDINKTILRIYGLKNVGKHALTNKLASYAYPNKYPPVNELKCLSFKKDYFTRKLQFLLNTKLHEIEIIQGSALESEPFQNILNLYMVVYSIDNKESFNAATQTISRLVENNRNNTLTQIILVGNKIDLQRKRKISKLEGKTIARIYNCSFIETSSLLSVNIDILWRKILRNIQRCQGTEESLLSRIINNGRRFTKSCEEIVAKLTFQSDSLTISEPSQV